MQLVGLAPDQLVERTAHACTECGRVRFGIGNDNHPPLGFLADQFPEDEGAIPRGSAADVVARVHEDDWKRRGRHRVLHGRRGIGHAYTSRSRRPHSISLSRFASRSARSGSLSVTTMTLGPIAGTSAHW